MRFTTIANLSVISLVACLSTASLAQDKKPVKPPQSPQSAPAKMTPEARKDMAEMYQKMADCLRTDKTLEQCSHETMKDCPVVKNTGHCPIHEGTMKTSHQHKP